MSRNRIVWFVTEAYYPDEVGTAYYMTELAERLAATSDVKTLCGFPIYDARKTDVPSVSVRNRVLIKRYRGTRFNKDRFVFRIVNLAAISLALFFGAVRSFKKNDVIIVVTSPPLLPFTIKAACTLKGSICVLRIDDVYPETLIATGMLKPRTLIGSVMTSLNRWLYDKADAIVVMGRDMDLLARRKLRRSFQKITIIPNWADIDGIRPRPKSETSLGKDLDLAAKFVVLCAGNMGRAQAIETMFAAAKLLKDAPDIRFLFIGSGAKRPWMNRQIGARSLANITILDQRPRADQNDFLNACDVCLISLVPGMTGAGVPSRMYNVMAAGKPIVALAPEESELCRVVLEEAIGWVVPPDDPRRLANVLRAAKATPERLAEMGIRARSAAEGKYSPARIIRKYQELIRSFDV